MSGMDVQRAVAILNRASQSGMYDPTKIPESDAAKLEAAEQQVQLCEQVEQVVHQAYPGWDDAQIAQKVPHWPAVSAVLAEAKVLVGANEPADPPDPEPPADEIKHPSVPREPSYSEPTAGPEYAPPKPEEQAAADALGQPIVSQGFLDDGPPRLAVPTGSDPSAHHVAPKPPPMTPDQGDPHNGEVWLDSRDNAWLVVHYSGGQSAEVKNVVSGEGTIVPAGFLKKRQPVATEVVKQANERSNAIIEAATVDLNVPHQHVPVEPVANATPPTLPPAPAVDTRPPPAVPPPSEIAHQVVEHEKSAESPSDASIETAKYDALVESVEKRYEPSGMPIPRDLQDPPSIDAETFADVDDATARILHSKYNALGARAKYLHDVEDATSRQCDLVRTHHMRRAMAVARKQLGASATVTEVKIVAEDDPLVIEWSEYARTHSDEARAFKTFFDIYSKHVEVLSRDWTMREAQVR